jgi:hypothetical protein
MTFQFSTGAAPQMNPAYANSFATPPVHFYPPVYQALPRSPTARDLEVQRCARILFEAASAVWGSSDEESNASDAEKDSALTSVTSGRILSSEQSPQPFISPQNAQLSVETNLGDQPSAVSTSQYVVLIMYLTSLTSRLNHHHKTLDASARPLLNYLSKLSP